MIERMDTVKNEQVEVYNRKAKAKYTAVALSIVYLSTSTTLELIEFKEHYTQKALQLQWGFVPFANGNFSYRIFRGTLGRLGLPNLSKNIQFMLNLQSLMCKYNLTSFLQGYSDRYQIIFKINIIVL